MYCPGHILRHCRPIEDSLAVIISLAAMSCWSSKARSQLTGHNCHSSDASHAGICELLNVVWLTAIWTAPEAVAALAPVLV